MIRSLAVARIQRGLGFRSDLSDEIISALQEAQRLLERGRSLPEFLLQEDQSFAVASGTAEAAVPTGFLREKQGETFRYTNSADELLFLEKMELSKAKEKFATSTPGGPLAYVLRKETVAIFPERDTSYTLTWSYYKKATALTSDIENEWLSETTGAPEALIGRAGMLIAEDLKNADALAKFQRLYTEGWLGNLASDITRQEEGYPLYMGGRL